jgi:hypothetical protein
VIEKVTLFLFTAFLILIAFCNRLSIDDLFFKYRIDTVGLSGIIDTQYSRVMAYFLNGCIIAMDSRFVYILYNLLSIAAFAYYLIKFVILLLPADYLARKRFALLFFLFVFFCCSGPDELFFWYTQVSTYLWCTTCILLVACFILDGFKHKWRIPLFFIACLFIGSSSEFLALQFLFLLLIAVICKKITFFTSKHRIIYSIGILLLLTSLIVTLTSPGTATRSEILEEAGIPGTILITLASMFSYFLRPMLWPGLLYVILFVLLFIGMGTQQKKSPKIRFGEFALYLLFVFCSMLLTSYQLNDITPKRALLICDLIGLFLLAKTAMLVGRYIKLSSWFTGWLRSVLLLLLLVFMTFEVVLADQYANAYDAREEVLQESKRDPIPVSRLPTPYFIQACNISTDSLDFRNQHLKLSHHLKANIIELHIDR